MIASFLSSFFFPIPYTVVSIPPLAYDFALCVLRKVRHESGSFIVPYTIMATVHIYQHQWKAFYVTIFFPDQYFPSFVKHTHTHSHMHKHSRTTKRSYQMERTSWGVFVCVCEQHGKRFPSQFSLIFTSNAARSSTISACPFNHWHLNHIIWAKKFVVKKKRFRPVKKKRRRQ